MWHKILWQKETISNCMCVMGKLWDTLHMYDESFYNILCTLFSVVCYCVALEISLNTLENVEGSHPKSCKALKCCFFRCVFAVHSKVCRCSPLHTYRYIHIYIFSYSACCSWVLEPEHGFLKMPIHLSPSMRGSGPCKYSFKLLQGFKYNKQEKWVILRE